VSHIANPLVQAAAGATQGDDDDEDLRYHAARERRLRLLTAIRQRGFCSSAELSQRLRVSEMTIRRDIRRLAEQGLVRAVHGGASAAPAPAEAAYAGTDFHVRAQQRAAVKRQLAQHAVRLIEPGAVIGLDAGTTGLELARVLPGDQRLTVVTHSLPVMAALAAQPGLEVIGLGGVFHHQTQSFTGPASLAALEHLRLRRFFLAASGIQGGAVLCANPFDSEVKRALIAIAEEVILVTDSSKFGRTAMTRVASLRQVRTAVVDSGISAEDERALRTMVAEVIVVPLGPPAEATSLLGSS